MKDVMGLIFTGENDIHLGELTSLRAVAALPIAGRYRVVDFQLSSMVHSGIKNVGVITQKNYSSLMDHIGSGREMWVTSNLKSRSKVSTMHLWPVSVSNVTGVMNWVAFLVMMTSTSAPSLRSALATLAIL